MQKVLVIHDFMLADKKLKGTKLLVYAFIYSYSQIPNSRYVVKWTNVLKFLGISKSSYFDALNWLVDNNYLDGDLLLSHDKTTHFMHHSDLSQSKIDEQIKIARYQWVK